MKSRMGWEVVLVAVHGFVLLSVASKRNTNLVTVVLYTQHLREYALALPAGSSRALQQPVLREIYICSCQWQWVFFSQKLEIWTDSVLRWLELTNPLTCYLSRIIILNVTCKCYWSHFGTLGIKKPLNLSLNLSAIFEMAIRIGKIFLFQTESP